MNPHLTRRRVAIGIVLLASVATIPPPLVLNAATPNHRGHRWVRSHQFTIAGLVRMYPKPFNVKQYREAGFGSVLTWEKGTFDELLPVVSAAGLPFHLHLEHWGGEATNRPDSNGETLGQGLRELDSEQNRARLAKHLAHPGCIGILANDEAVRPTYLRYTRHLLKWLRAQHPEALVYSNAHPAGHEGVPGYGNLEQYLDEFAAMVEPDVLMTDVYPLGHPDGTAYNYFKILAAVRKVALEHGMPYWIFIQSFERHGRSDRRLPSESDLRFQMFVPLTYGYTGILYFTYDLAYERGLIEKSGEPNRLYHAAALANPEVANVGAAVRFLTSTDVFYVQGHDRDGEKTTLNALPRDTKKWMPDAGGDTRIENVTIDSPGKGKDGLLGLFRDDQGRQYFMLTNLWHNAEASAAKRTVTFALQFADDVKQLYRLDRQSGKAVPVELKNGRLHLPLPGGTGELFKYTADPFPGTVLPAKTGKRVSVSGTVMLDGQLRCSRSQSRVRSCQPAPLGS